MSKGKKFGLINFLSSIVYSMVTLVITIAIIKDQFILLASLSITTWFFSYTTGLAQLSDVATGQIQLSRGLHIACGILSMFLLWPIVLTISSIILTVEEYKEKQTETVYKLERKE